MGKEKEKSAIEKLEYIYEFLDKGNSDVDTAKKYVQELADDIDLSNATHGSGRQCRTGETIPGH